MPDRASARHCSWEPATATWSPAGISEQCTAQHCVRARDIRNAKWHHTVDAVAAILDHGACNDIKGIPPPGLDTLELGAIPNCDSLCLFNALSHAPPYGADRAHATGEAVA